MKNNEDTSTKERILEATVNLLYTAALDEITSRRIAKESNVNIAAINYHFQSKEKLINEAVAAGTGQAFDKGMKVLLASGKKPFDRLKGFLTGYAHGLMEFPSLTRTAFLSFFPNEAENNPYGRYTREMTDKIGQVIGEISGRKGNQENVTRAVMVISCIIFPFLISNTLRESGSIDYANKDERDKYIKAVLDIIAGTAEKKES